MKPFLKKRLRGFHKRFSHTNRTKILAEIIAQEMTSLTQGKRATVRCLDVGCGDLKLSSNIIDLYPNSSWYGVDIFPRPKEHDNKWERYKAFDGKNIPFSDNEFDVALLSDVLHHAKGDMTPLLNEVLRVANTVIVKDHFEFGFTSRQLLRLMDFIGNWGYNVNVPKKYFTKSSFLHLCTESGAKIISLKEGIELYNHLPIIKFITQPKWQFIAIIKLIK